MNIYPTQASIDAALDRHHTIAVSISPNGLIPQNNPHYTQLLQLPQTGFTITPREFLHAIGCKTAALPMSEQDECIKVAWLYAQILDLTGPVLRFQGHYGSDLQSARSQEIGIGMMCLIAERYFHIPWDQLGPIVGQGMRFDYRGNNGNSDCIFESKGTSHETNQSSQINSGLEKKAAHHERNEHFDVELIISTFISRDGTQPRILLADPDKSSFKELYEKADSRFYRLRHYCRALQFVGLPRSAYLLNRYAREYLEYGTRSLYRDIMLEKEDVGYLKAINISGDVFLGRWFHDWLPEKSKRYFKQYEKSFELRKQLSHSKVAVFQGIRKDIYESGFGPEPFSKPLLAKAEIEKYRQYEGSRVSVFTDGTLQIIRNSYAKNL